MVQYAAIYWAAACLVFWAGSGVTDGMLIQAIDMVCDAAGLTVPQEALLKRLVHKMMGGSNGTD